MIKKIFILLFVLTVNITFAQKAQKVGYIDMEYILENVPEYQKSQSKLDAKINTWNGKLSVLKQEIDALKLNLSNEKALLTNDLIEDREEDIQIKETEFKEAQENYFGPAGDLFLLRKQLVKPVQDQIFNAVQDISKRKKYDMVFDKSSDLIMLYSNDKYDISDLVLNVIVKGRKKEAVKKKKNDREKAVQKKKEELGIKKQDRLSKQEALRERVRKSNEARAAKRDSLKKANILKRQKKAAEIKARREAQKNKNRKVTKTVTSKKENVSENIETETEEIKISNTEDVKEVVKTKAQLREEKRQQLLKRIEAQNRKRDSLKKVAADKRAKKLADIEARKKKLEEDRNK
jgi:Skp family chaperone for outer membrane proteins